jgi:glycosyltransferase involved in cell wall biosynthesis
MKKILLIDFCNYIDYPIGGYLTFSQNLISVFEDQLVLIGITTDKNDPVGVWCKKNINGKMYDFFALARYNTRSKKRLIPDRLKSYFLLQFYKKKILARTFQNVIIQRQEILPAVKGFGFRNICYRFPGIENPLSISKYWMGSYFASFFERIFFSSFKTVATILASADEEAINEMIVRSKGKIRRTSIIKFPTRIDTRIFRPTNKQDARNSLKISPQKTVIMTTGRLTLLKGWKFMIDSFSLFEKKNPNSIFYFVGAGEDYQKIKDYISLKCLDQKIILAGQKSASEISVFLNASDLFIMGSYKEGWPTSLIEAVGCGIPVCVTKFSAAKEIITEGINGYIDETRDITKFTDLMLKALKLEIENVEMSDYSISTLKDNLLHNWPLV